MTSLADSLLARIISQRNLVAAMDEHCKAISARVASRDQNVSVEVDGFGAITELRFGPNAAKLGSTPLANLVVETAQAAARVAADRQAYLTKEFDRRLRELHKAPLARSDGSTFQPGDL
jgi:YbaB/EbfC DNA-binding family